MCNPQAIQVAVAIGTAVVQGYSQHRAAEAQEEVLKRAQREQETQINQSASAEADARVRMAREERARLRAASAESGVAGISIVDLLDNVDMQAGTDVARIALNQQNRINASRTEMQSRMAGIKQPDWLGLGMQAGMQIWGGGMGAGAGAASGAGGSAMGAFGRGGAASMWLGRGPGGG